MRSCSDSERIDLTRALCKSDLFFLLWYALGRTDMERPWLLDRCKEVQAAPNDRLDLWSREHYKSTIITFGLTIQDILNDPETTIGIFSHTRPIAKGFLRQIKREFEANELLKSLFPDVLWTSPSKEAPKWSEDDGIVVKRKSNPKESTIEAWGLVDGQPTSKHYRTLLYDDVVTLESVTSPEMMQKTTSALEVSYNLGAQGGNRRFVGTRYHFNDSYKTLLSRGTAKPRVYPATVDGSETGEPVLWTTEQLRNKRRDMGPYTFSCQILLNPKGDGAQGFKREWLRYYKDHQGGAGMNKYILVDAANGKRKENDFTSMWVVGLGPDRNYYALDIVRDRLNLSERAARLFALHRKWRPIQVRYERYGMMGDIAHIESEQERHNYRFEITEVAGQTPKVDRIKRLVPIFEQGRFYLPPSLHITDYERKTVDMVSSFVEDELIAFPVSVHDDMLDALARIEEPEIPVQWPTFEDFTQTEPEAFSDGI